MMSLSWFVFMNRDYATTDTNFSTAIKVVKKIAEDKVNCMAFIEFEAASSAAKVVCEENLKIEGSDVRAVYALPLQLTHGYQRAPNKRTFDLKVSGFKASTKPSDVVKSFKGGRIKYVSQEKGFLLVSFDDENVMKTALKECENLEVNGDKLSVELAKKRFRRNGRLNKSG